MLGLVESQLKSALQGAPRGLAGGLGAQASTPHPTSHSVYEAMLADATTGPRGLAGAAGPGPSGAAAAAAVAGVRARVVVIPQRPLSSDEVDVLRSPGGNTVALLMLALAQAPAGRGAPALVR